MGGMHDRFYGRSAWRDVMGKTLTHFAGEGVLLTPSDYTVIGISIGVFSIAILLVLIVSLSNEIILRRRKVLIVGLWAHLMATVGELLCWVWYERPGALASLGLGLSSNLSCTFKVIVAIAILAYVSTDASDEPLRSLRTRHGFLALLSLYLVDLLLCLINPMCGLYSTIGEANTIEAGPLIDFFSVMLGMQPVALFAAVPRLRKRHGNGTALRLLIGGSLMLFALLTGALNMRLLVTPSITLELLLLTVGVQLRSEEALAEARVEAAETHVKLLSGQIRPHFIFNSLNTIKALISEDSALAERTVQDFADYLRSHLDVMSSTCLVPFEEEMSHVRHYVSLEATSSERPIELAIDCPVEDFSLPSLTVQPLVENAIRHGLRSREEGGTIVVRTRETDEAITISICDDGCGFVPEKDVQEPARHVGIANVRERLERQCHGSLSIRSGSKGTTATITLPKECR